MSRNIYFLNLLLSCFLFCFFSTCNQSPKEIVLTPGMIINESVKIKKGTYHFYTSDSLMAGITIKGDHIEIDFNGAELVGAKEIAEPDQFKGMGILIQDGAHIKIKNLKVRGYKIGLMAKDVDHLEITDTDMSYNFRQKLKSTWERENLSDWLSYHNNEKGQWVRYGAGIYLHSCDHAIIKNTKVTGGQNGLLLVRSKHGLFYNNNMSFNSGLGIGLYRSSNNRILHNKLDWCIRGYSHGKYNRGQDSAGLLLYEQSSKNTIAYNSATHSGDGLFLWAGQTTLDKGTGGCNDNLVYGNDFSHASNNGVEITFSSNKIINNRIEDCDYGVWGGYSHNTLIVGNKFKENQHAIAFEHGQENIIRFNTFEQDEEGIWLWERKNQPADWGFSKKRNVESKNYDISTNLFIKVNNPLRISHTATSSIKDNQFYRFQNLLKETAANEDLNFKENKIYQVDLLGIAEKYKSKNEILNGETYSKLNVAQKIENYAPDQIADGMDAFLPKDHFRGRKYMLVNEWGPYDFSYPSIWLRNIEGDKYTFALFGPTGNWKVVDGKGFQALSTNRGTMPATLVLTRATTDASELIIELEFIGEAGTTIFGAPIKKGTIVPFHFYRFAPPLNWSVDWYEYTEKSNPLTNYEQFKKLKNKKPAYSETTKNLVYNWWKSPGGNIHPDRFATFAESTFEITPDTYTIRITSDDGLKFYLDGKLLIDRWDIHVPTTDELNLTLGGKHKMEIEHFEGGGFANLIFEMNKKRAQQK